MVKMWAQNEKWIKCKLWEVSVWNNASVFKHNSWCRLHTFIFHPDLLCLALDDYLKTKTHTDKLKTPFSDLCLQPTGRTFSFSLLLKRMPYPPTRSEGGKNKAAVFQYSYCHWTERPEFTIFPVWTIWPMWKRTWTKKANWTLVSLVSGMPGFGSR